jgi:hypothetical protein
MPSSFLFIFTKNKNIADVIWKSEQAIPVNKIIILCLQSRDFSSKWRAIKQLVDDFSPIRMVVAIKTER